MFVEFGYVDPGTHSVTSQIVRDDWYDPTAQRCTHNCEQLNNLNIHNEMRGGELVVGYQHEFVELIKPYLKGGIAGFAHHHSGTYHQWPQDEYPVVYLSPENPMEQNFEGLIIAGVVGGGLCIGMVKVDVCGDVSYYPFLAHTANPLLDSVVLTTGQVRVPF